MLLYASKNRFCISNYCHLPLLPSNMLPKAMEGQVPRTHLLHYYRSRSQQNSLRIAHLLPPIC